MPKMLIVHDENGKIIRTQGGMHDIDTNAESYLYPGELYDVLNLEGMPVPTMNRYDRKARKLIGIGLPPTPYHDYDWKNFEWKGDETRLRLGKRQQIEAALAAKVDEKVMMYDGKFLDADARSKEAVRNKTAAIASRIAQNAPTSVDQLYWKDHDNIIHKFSDMKTYKQWLDGFLIALDDRTEAARAWANDMKQQLNAASTFDELMKLEVPPIAP